MARPLKPALTHEQQIALLRSQGMTFGDMARAERVMSRVSVYRLRAYWIGLCDEKHFRGLAFEDVVSLYDFDARLRRILLGALEHIEIALRAKIAYVHGKNHGAEGYRDRDNFINAQHHGEFMNAIDRSMARAKNHPILRHHERQYGGRYPVWVAVEFCSFGPLSKLFANLLPDDAREVARDWPSQPKPPFLESWLHMFTIMRNICAHHGRLYNIPIHAKPRMYSEEKQYAQSVKLFAMLLVTRRALPQDVWGPIYEDIMALCDVYSDVINTSYMGFPDHYRELLAPKLLLV